MNNNLFNSICKVRVAMYDLVDQGVMSNDCIDSFEESLLDSQGIDYCEYLEWKEADE